MPAVEAPNELGLGLDEETEKWVKVATPAAAAVTMSGGRWVPHAHLKVINRALLEVADKSLDLLILELPPRYGKSEFVSKYFPCWFLGNYPDQKVLLCSYEADFAASWGRKARELMEEFGPELFGVSVDGKSRAASRWRIEHYGGEMNTAGVGGPITGKGADVAIIDDPIKNDEEALSEKRREKIKEWYKSTFTTRLQSGGVIIIIQTRWHPDDLAGWTWRKAKQHGLRCRRITLPELAYYPNEIPENEKEGLYPDALGRQPGEPLCPAMVRPDEIIKRRDTMGEFWFWALKQQRPIPATGGMFRKEWFKYWKPASLLVKWSRVKKCFEYFDVSKRYKEVIISVDCSYKKTETGSYTVIQVWARDKNNNFLLLDSFRARIDLDQMCVELIKMSHKWPMARTKLIEGKASGPEVIKKVKSKLPGCISVTPEGGKDQRAAAFVPDLRGGYIYVPESSHAIWVEEFISEMCSFPRGTNDDQVDAFSQAMAHWNGTGVFMRVGRGGTNFDRMVG